MLERCPTRSLSHGMYKLILSKFSLLDLSGDAFDIGPLFSIRELSKHIWYNCQYNGLVSMNFKGFTTPFHHALYMPQEGPSGDFAVGPVGSEWTLGTFRLLARRRKQPLICCFTLSLSFILCFFGFLFYVVPF